MIQITYFATDLTVRTGDLSNKMKFETNTHKFKCTTGNVLQKKYSNNQTMPYTGYNIATGCKFLLVKLETVAAKLYADRNIRHIKIKVLYVPLRVRFHCPSFGFFIVTLDYQVACTPTTISQVPLCTSTKQSDFLFWACITIISPLEFQP